MILGTEVSLLGVLLAAIASMIVGSLWYGPLFGKQWMKVVGMTKKDLQKAKEKGMGGTMGIAFVASLVMAFVLATFIELAGMGAAIVAFWVWVGFLATTLLDTVLWENRSWNLYVINAGHRLVGLLVMGLVIGLF